MAVEKNQVAGEPEESIEDMRRRKGAPRKDGRECQGT